jgi:pimeloyl-ACP methyl ester carboxylesterase
MGEWYVDTTLRMLDRTPEPADQPILTDPVIRSMYVASNLEGARQGQTGLISDWVAEALPWGFQLADISVPVDLWVGEQDPARAPLDAPELARRIPVCSVHSDPDAGHWLLMSHWQEIGRRSIS